MKSPSLKGSGGLGILEKLVARLNSLFLHLSILAVLLAVSILTVSVIARYLFNIPTDWQDEICVFLLVGSVFLSSGYVQSVRGHIGIEFLDSVLSPKVNKIRLVLIDLVAFLFCTFFAWKCWHLLGEAVLENKTTSSVWGTPLSIPYSMMSVGMSLLALQVFLQFLTGLHQAYKGE